MYKSFVQGRHILAVSETNRQSLLPSYDAFDTTDDFMTLWNKIVRETEEIKTSMECNQCKLRHVCNTCAAAAIAECGDSEGVSKYLCEYTKETVRNLKEFY